MDRISQRAINIYSNSLTESKQFPELEDLHVHLQYYFNYFQANLYIYRMYH